jgi:hypothetical protein
VGRERKAVGGCGFSRGGSAKMPLMGQMGRAGMGLAQNTYSGRAKLFFRIKNACAEFVCTQNGVN